MTLGRTDQWLCLGGLTIDFVVVVVGCLCCFGCAVEGDGVVVVVEQLLWVTHWPNVMICAM